MDKQSLFPPLPKKLVITLDKLGKSVSWGIMPDSIDKEKYKGKTKRKNPYRESKLLEQKS